MPFDRKLYMKEYHKQWYEKNKLRLLARYKVYASKNMEKIDAYKRQWYQENQERCQNKAEIRYATGLSSRRMYNLKTLYGLSVTEYESLFRNQKGVCAICGVPSKRQLSVDHCHNTKRVRGLLCHKCNFAIGLFQDNPALLVAASVYLKESL